jgi:hypothetical protein
VKLTTRLNLVQRSMNEWSYTSTPQYVFMASCLVKKEIQGTTLPFYLFTFLIYLNHQTFGKLAEEASVTQQRSQ